jgi:hypothetical protein
MNLPQPSCPKCNETLEADFGDNGFGEQKVGPWSCSNPACYWVEGDEGLQPIYVEIP